MIDACAACAYVKLRDNMWLPHTEQSLCVRGGRAAPTYRAMRKSVLILDIWQHEKPYCTHAYCTVMDVANADCPDINGMHAVLTAHAVLWMLADLPRE